MNANVARFPKPYVALMQGHVLGGGVGVGCHGGCRVVGDTSRVAMPECLIGLIPDVGGTHLLAGAPGRLGEYLGLTGHRMGPGEAIAAGFADHYAPEAIWPEMIRELVATGDPAVVAGRAMPPPPNIAAKTSSASAALSMSSASAQNTVEASPICSRCFGSARKRLSAVV